MHLQFITRVGAAALLAACLLSSPAEAKDGRDFAGFYSLTNVSDAGNRVHFTLTLQLFNHSGADLRQVVVTVGQSQPQPEPLASSAPVPLWRAGQDLVVTHEITVPRDEFQRSTEHGQPNVLVFYSSEDGQTSRQPAQITERAQVP